MTIRRRGGVRVLAALLTVAVLGLAGCSGQPQAEETTSPSRTRAAEAQAPAAPVVVLGASESAALALSASQTFFTTAPVVVLARADSPSEQETAAAVAVEITAPVLLVGGSVADKAIRAEIKRLGARAVVVITNDDAVGLPSATPTESSAYPTFPDAERIGIDADALLDTGELDPRDLADLRRKLPAVAHPETLKEVLALTEGTAAQTAAVATARAAGAVPLVVPGGDPRAKAEIVEAVAQAHALAVVAIGASFGTSASLEWKLRTAEGGTELPGGGQLVFGNYRYVAVPGMAVTASFRAASADAISRTVLRAESARESLAADVSGPLAAALEIPVTMASRSPGGDGNFSLEIPADQLVPLLDAAATAGVYVLLRFEPGTASFAEQIPEYVGALSRPGVGVSLDIDTRRESGMRYGTVSAREVSEAIAAVSELVRSKRLPQKMVVLRASSPQAVADWTELRLGQGEVAVVALQANAAWLTGRVRGYDDLKAAIPAGVRLGWTIDTKNRAAEADALKGLEPAPGLVVTTR